MKYLINQIIIIILINLTCFNTQNAQAQSVIFEYDAAGNMKQRSLSCVEKPPGVPIVKNIFDNSAFISWEGVRDITGFQLKKEGSQWQNTNTTQSAVVLGQLQSCQKYLVRLLYNCNNKTEYTPEISFTTSGCVNCSATDMNIYAIPQQKSMTINWDVYPQALYTIHYRKAGENNFVTYTTPIPFVFMPVLEACTTYEFALKIKCSDGTVSPLGNIFSFSTSGCRLGIEAETTLLHVNPNPASKDITIEIDSKQNLQQLAIYNSSGQIVHQLQPLAGTNVYYVELDDLATGVYLVKAQLGDKVITKKFSVQ